MNKFLSFFTLKKKIIRFVLGKYIDFESVSLDFNDGELSRAEKNTKFSIRPPTLFSTVFIVRV